VDQHFGGALTPAYKSTWCQSPEEQHRHTAMRTSDLTGFYTFPESLQVNAQTGP
jgi:hypothetical protein